MPKQSKPNIILFMVDQMTAFALNIYGGTVCKTPHIDALAARGTVFENAYCNYPLCAPARFSMMSGRLPSRIGAYDNGAELAAAVPTIAHYLRLHGYYTAISGKMHFVGPDQFHGFEERLTTEIYPADFSWTPVAGYKNPLLDEERNYTAGVSTIDTVFDSGPVARSMQIDYDEEVIHCATRELYTIARSKQQCPFFLTISLTHPHDPYVITQDYWDLYSNDDIDPPRTGFIPLEQRDPHSRALYYHYGQDKRDLTSETYKRARRGYYGMISYVDDLFGQVVQVLKDADFLQNTIILFTSDHGDMMGERGMWFKKTLFEPAIRVPLIIAPPSHSASRVSSPVTLIDVFPTIIDLAGIPADMQLTSLDGRSLTPALKGSAVAGPVYVEHIDGGTVAPRVMVREEEYKLVLSRGYPTQLYNLAEDPDELSNLSGRPEFSEIEDRLVQLAESNWNLDQLAKDVYADQTARKLIDSALTMGRREIWDFAPRPLAHNSNYVRQGDSFPDVERRGYFPYP